MKREEEVVFGEIFPNFKGSQHSKRNLWSKAAQRKLLTQILGMFQEFMCKLPPSSN